MKKSGACATLFAKSAFVALIVVMILTAGCAQLAAPGGLVRTPPQKKETAPNPLSCSIDEDCVCQGIDKKTGNCFIGNKQYYEKYVDKSKGCPDFCSGIAGNLVVKCVNNECLQTFGCVLDTECSEKQSCVNNRCVDGKTASSSDAPSSRSQTNTCSTDADCVAGGCSGTICQSKKAEPVVTTCEYRSEYACYKQISCGCVAGHCAWNEDARFKACVAQAKTQEGGDFPV
ncbi:eight-cysteine-cluster domain-containing protein [Candidatus Woesearchaeota archaeon]|nr:eight-cysteine-cluster domain-containing protein [Candidatus Woesearchaeota archaeon]